jgi:hypothetical protein
MGYSTGRYLTPSSFFEFPRGDRVMHRYDPLEAPDPEEWLALDEQERIDLARDYHRRARIRVPNAKVHAMLHATRRRNARAPHGATSHGRGPRPP